MSSPHFWSNVVLLICVTAPIAVAEGSMVYLLAVGLVGVVGRWSSVRIPRTVLTEHISQGLVLLAFGYLILEHLVFDRILVMALSHFLITVCMVRLVQARRYRDDAQIVVLCLMLLVVCGIVSGDILFVVALIMTMTVGVWTLIRLHLAVESVTYGSAGISAAASGSGPPSDALDPRMSVNALRSVTAGISAAGILVGIAVFLACPRVESNFLRQLQGANAGPVLTGFSSGTDISGGQTISPSERAVMRVLISGSPLFSAEEHESEHYFRGRVAERYGRSAGGLAAGWGWRRTSASDPSVAISLEPPEYRATLGYSESIEETLHYRIWLEAAHGSTLFTPYPAISISSHDFLDVRFNPRDHLFRARKAGRLVSYNVSTVSPYAASQGRYRAEFEMEVEPRPVSRDVPLPRADEVLRLIDARIGDCGPLDVPANRETFVSKLEDYLSSPAFAYTLSPPRVPVGREPVGEFLLETREGHCEYFASAMAVVCQLQGIPARFVTGYRGGEFNAVGGFLVVREKHAHAWVEVFIPGKGWQAYDPTPGASRIAAAGGTWYDPVTTFLDFLQFQWVSLVVAYDAGARQELIDRFLSWVTRPAQDETNLIGAVAAFVRELFGWRLELSAGDRVLYWVFALLVVTLVVLVGYMLVRLGRWTLSAVGRCGVTLRSRSGHPEVEFYNRFCRRLDALGLRRRPDQTPAEFAEELAGRYTALQAAPELVRLYYGLAFGGRALSPDRLSWVDQFLRELKQVDQETLQMTSAPVAPAVALSPSAITPAVPS